MKHCIYERVAIQVAALYALLTSQGACLFSLLIGAGCAVQGARDRENTIKRQLVPDAYAL